MSTKMISVILLSANLVLIEARQHAIYTRTNISCVEQIGQSDKPKTLLQCSAFCSNDPQCEAIRFDDQICEFYEKFCCDANDVPTELFVNEEILNLINSKSTVIPKSIHRGCWQDTRDRALPDKLNGNVSKEKCYELAIKSSKPFKFYGLQAGQQCFASTDKNDYKKHGRSDRCKNGHGGGWAFDAYKIICK